MANIIERAEYSPDVYLISTTDDVIGGVDGISNRQAHQLANRTAFLKIRAEQLNAQVAVLEQQMQNLGGVNINQIQSDLAQVKQDTATALSYVPAGFIQASLRNPALDIPPGYLLCNGAGVSRTTYKDLFAAINIAFGQGDGVETFNLPDLRGKFIRGLGGSAPNASAAWAQTQLDALQNIKGKTTPTGASEAKLGHPSGVFYKIKNHNAVVAGKTVSGYSRTDGLGFDASRVARTAAETRPINMAVNWFIKY